MATHTFIRSSAAVAASAAALLASHATPAAHAAPATCGARALLSAATPATLHVVRTLGRLRAVPPAYGWPVKPFDRQHPVRAFLDDPRIGAHGSRAFHFGIDVAAPDGTDVYAVEPGILYLSHGSLAVVSGPSHEFGYWHVKAARGLREHQIVHRHQLLGTILPGWTHVHFAERVGRDYVNPLRPGGLGPYTDPVPPTIAEVSLARAASGGLMILADAYDTTWPPVPGPWAREPVAPALIQWRALGSGGGLGRWHTAVDFRHRMLDRSLFDSIYAPPTAQNHMGEAGLYCFYVAHDWKPADGTYRLEVAASDTRGNRAIASLDATLANGRVQS
jgi:hypothetical protein